MKVIGIIPARYHSSRFPGKPLIDLLGKPMIIWVADIASKALGKENVYVATDDERIKDVVKKYGYQALMTSNNALTGTDRVYEASQLVDADVYINIQGDEPLLNPLDIRKIAEYKMRYPNEVINGMCGLSEYEDPNNINIPKVVTTEDNRLIYISRLAIPGSKRKIFDSKLYKKQVCIYAFNKKELEAYYSLNRKSYVEEIEDIEILRFFELSIPIRMVETTGNSLAIDIPEDVPKVIEALKKEC